MQLCGRSIPAQNERSMPMLLIPSRRRYLYVRLALVAACAALVVTVRAAVPVQPTFAVASIYPSDPNGGTRMTLNFSGDSFRAVNVPLSMLIRMAYDLNDDQVSGGPPWIGSRRFDIIAKPETAGDPPLKPDAAMEQRRLMLQALLADRFQLKLHHETKNVSGYILTVEKSGTKDLVQDEGGDQQLAIDGGKLDAKAITMDQLASVLGSRILQSPVKNMTGLAGKFDGKLTWDPKQTLTVAPADAGNDAGPSLFVALQQQLGLKLEYHKTAADAIVVESAAMPSEN
jgi:uncharacterized protein (TIGR03435 family)